MKRVLLASLLAACAFAASAQTSVSAQADVSTQTRTDAAATPQAQADAQANAQANADSQRGCLRHTGTHIRDRSTTAKASTDKSGRKGCVAANGRVYSRDDINRTGQTDIGEALRQLDPSIR